MNHPEKSGTWCLPLFRASSFRASLFRVSLFRTSLLIGLLALQLENACQAALPAELVESPAQQTWTSQLDELFARGVQGLTKVIFYRLGQSDSTYARFQPEMIYVRDAGTAGPFRHLQGGDDQAPPQLSSEQLEVLAARQRLEIVETSHSWLRAGTLQGKPVEFVVVYWNPPDVPVNAGDVLTLLPEQHTFERTDSSGQKQQFSAETLQSWDQRGWLQHSPGPTSDEPAWQQHSKSGGVPIIVAWLSIGALYYTLTLRFFCIRGFYHAVEIVTGKYDKADEAGEVTHFQALTSALAGTLGLGNISGVTIAMCLGGPGAFFWMLVAGVLGMSSKFAECTLGLKYRTILPDGSVLGGPMQYLQRGFARRGAGLLGTFLAMSFAIMCILGSAGGGNMLQANQAVDAALHLFQHEQHETFSQLTAQMAEAENDPAALAELQSKRSLLQQDMRQFGVNFRIGYGLLLSVFVALVILGGIRRIGQASERIIPLMCAIYSAACLAIIARHWAEVPSLMLVVLQDAFSGTAVGGGLVGVFVVGSQRALFSNEAGTGSAPIAHSAARTQEPVREGCVALLEPFIDTVVVCSLTALVILITGAWNHPDWVQTQGLTGAALTSRAFGEEFSWFPAVLAISITLFAYSTILSWSYYGERSWVWLFGQRTTVVYRLLTVSCTFFGTLASLGSVLDFSDMMMLGMGFPNILGILILSPEVFRDLKDYWARYRRGEFEVEAEGEKSIAA
jgi:AGCS family alanine or glycine:cation symporter